MNRYEREIKGIDAEQVKHAKAIQDLYALEEKEDRGLNEDERLKVEEHTKAIRVLDEQKAEAEANLKTIKEAEAVGRELGTVVPSLEVGKGPHERWAEEVNRQNKSLGEQFIESKGYKAAIEEYQANGGRFRQGFSTGSVALSMKGTLLEGAGSPGSGTGGGLIPVPQEVGGIVQTLFQGLTFADLLLSGQSSGNTMRYVVEGTATSGAAGVAEGGTKPESTVALSTKDEPIKKIATLLPVSEEMLEDAPAVQAYINGRLSLFVRIEEERQLLRGTSGGNEVQGILTSRGVPVYAGGSAQGDKAAQLFKAMTGMRGSAFVEPEWIVMHPTDWQDIRLLKDGVGGTSGQYFGGGPFFGPYGGPQGPAGASGQVSGANDSIWNKQVYVTAALGGAGTALVGTRANAQVWRKGGINVEASNSHSNYFQLNLVAIRAEERLGLAVYRPAAYVEVRLS